MATILGFVSLNFISLIIVVFGILQVILFFKIWIMTDDVKMIKDSIANGADISFRAAQKEIMLGNPEKAFEIYKKCFINDIMKIYREMLSGASINTSDDNNRYSTKYNEKCKVYQKELEKLGDDYLIDFSRFNTFDKVNAILK